MLENLVMEIAIIVFIFGAMIGSFLNVVIYRIPKGESIVFPSSKCQSCQNALKWWHNIPIFSWIFLKRKMLFLQRENICTIPSLLNSLQVSLFVALYFKLGLVWYLPFIAASFAALLALVMIDFKYMAVPDNVNFAALFLHWFNLDFFSTYVCLDCCRRTLSHRSSLVSSRKKTGNGWSRCHRCRNDGCPARISKLFCCTLSLCTFGHDTCAHLER